MDNQNTNNFNSSYTPQQDPLTGVNSNVQSSQMQQAGAPVKYNGPISTGGFSPEVVSSDTATSEQTPNEESGYEQIKKIEQAAEKTEKQQAHQSERKSEETAKEDASRREKKEVPTGVKTKYFGYNPPPSIANNTDYIQKNAGKGNKAEAKTWLLVFLDRLLKKESE